MLSGRKQRDTDESLCEGFLCCHGDNIAGEFHIMSGEKNLLQALNARILFLFNERNRLFNERKKLKQENDNLRAMLRDIQADIIIDEFINSFDDLTSN